MSEVDILQDYSEDEGGNAMDNKESLKQKTVNLDANLLKSNQALTLCDTCGVPDVFSEIVFNSDDTSIINTNEMTNTQLLTFSEEEESVIHGENKDCFMSMPRKVEIETNKEWDYDQVCDNSKSLSVCEPCTGDQFGDDHKRYDNSIISKETEEEENTTCFYNDTTLSVLTEISEVGSSKLLKSDDPGNPHSVTGVATHHDRLFSGSQSLSPSIFDAPCDVHAPLHAISTHILLPCESLEDVFCSDTVPAGEGEFVRTVHSCAAQLDFDSLEQLVFAGQNVNSPDPLTGLTPLQTLCCTPTSSDTCVSCLQLLLDNEADSHITDLHGNSLLHLCVLAGNHRAVETLLSFERLDGAKAVDDSLLNARGESALHLSAQRNELKCMQLLVLHGQLNVRTSIKHFDDCTPSTVESSNPTDKPDYCPSPDSHVAPNTGRWDSRTVTRELSDSSDVFLAISSSSCSSSNSINSNLRSDNHGNVETIKRDTEPILSAAVTTFDVAGISESASLAAWEWVRCETEEGDAYYYHPGTQTSQWNNPFDPAPSLAAGEREQESDDPWCGEEETYRSDTAHFDQQILDSLVGASQVLENVVEMQNESSVAGSTLAWQQYAAFIESSGAEASLSSGMGPASSALETKQRLQEQQIELSRLRSAQRGTALVHTSSSIHQNDVTDTEDTGGVLVGPRRGDVRGVPCVWMECCTEDGSEYFYNSETGHVQWERPVELMIESQFNKRALEKEIEVVKPAEYLSGWSVDEVLTNFLPEEKEHNPNVLTSVTLPADELSAPEPLSSSAWQQYAAFKESSGAETSLSSGMGPTSSALETKQRLQEQQIELSRLRSAQRGTALVQTSSSICQGDNDQSREKEDMASLVDQSESWPWVECFTVAGDAYFYNSQTEQVQWEDPSLSATVGPSRPLNSFRGALENTGRLAQDDPTQAPLVAKQRRGMVTHTRVAAISAPSIAAVSEAFRPPYLQQEQFSPNASTGKSPNDDLYAPFDHGHLISDNGNIGDIFSHSAAFSGGASVSSLSDQSHPDTEGQQLSPSLPELTLSLSYGMVQEVGEVGEDVGDAQSGSDNTSRHLQIWSRFFENALLSGGSQQSSSPRPRKVTSSKNSAKQLLNLAESTSKRRPPPSSSSGSAPNKWPGPLSERRYRALLALTTPEINESGVQNRVDGTILSAALLAAVARSDVRTAESLLLAGANPNCVDDQIRSPLHFASKAGNRDTLSLLCDQGADLETCDASGRTPLHIAAIFRQPVSMQFLLASAVNCDAVDVTGNTALHLSARCGDFECCRLLVFFGASGKHLRNAIGLTALEVAQRMQPQTADLREVVRILVAEDVSSFAGVETEETRVDQPQEGEAPGLSSPFQSPAHGAYFPPLAGTSSEFARQQPILPHNTKLGAPEKSSLSFPHKGVNQQHNSLRYSGQTVREGIDDRRNLLKVTRFAPDTMPKSETTEDTTVASEEEEDDESEEDESEEEVGFNVTDAVASSVWGVAASLIDISLSMFSPAKSTSTANAQPSAQAKQRESNWFGAFFKKDPSTSEDAVLKLIGGAAERALSPPTDRELLRQGLGFHTVSPPDIVAEEIGAQVEALRSTGTTPQRPVSSTPPNEVQVAVAMARASAERSRGDGGGSGYSAAVPQPLTSILIEKKIPSHSDDSQFVGFALSPASSFSLLSDTHNRPPPTAVNGYSIGNTLPKGVSWRYVDVMNQK